MTEDYVIREFEQNDIESVVAINRSCLPENYPDHFFMGLHYHAPQAFLIALDPEHIFGYIMCRIERGISTFGKMPVKKDILFPLPYCTKSGIRELAQL